MPDICIEAASDGQGTKVLIDGQPVLGLTKVVVTFEVGQLATLELKKFHINEQNAHVVVESPMGERELLVDRCFFESAQITLKCAGLKLVENSAGWSIGEEGDRHA